jgi:hypothetical protein
MKSTKLLAVLAIAAILVFGAGTFVLMGGIHAPGKELPVTKLVTVTAHVSVPPVTVTRTVTAYVLP